jgi:thiol:disulfide interchange protein DsbD
MYLNTRLLPLIFSTLLLVLSTPLLAHAELVVQTPHTRVTLLSDHQQVQPGQKFHLGFQFEIIPDWHIYWENPGDSGLAPVKEYSVPQGVRVSEFIWPAPERIPVGPLMNFGYSNTVLLPFSVQLPADFRGDTFEIALKLDWLICKEDCLPQGGEFVLGVPVSGQSSASSAAPVFARTLGAIPKKFPGTTSLVDQGTFLTLIVNLPDPDQVTSAYFFPRDGVLVEPAAEQRFSATEQGLQLELRKNPSFTELTPQSSGILEVARQGKTTDFLDLQLAPRIFEASSSTLYSEKQSLFVTLVLAFLGGIILNLMPCVFPVISIKVFNFMHKAKSGNASVRTHALTFSAGIISSMLLLGIGIVLIKGAGSEIGWGFQLQSPEFVGLMALLFFALSLSFLGYFEFGQGLASGAGKISGNSNGLRGSFLSGILTTAIATPCTGPFLGVALGFALSQSTLVSMLVFLAIGLGIAAPYLLLALKPDLIRFLPKPGAWMDTLKQFLAFPLLLTAFYFLWVIAQQSTSAGILLVIGSMLMLFTALWLRREIAAKSHNSILRGFAKTAAVVLLLLSIFNVFLIPPSQSGRINEALNWQVFRPGLAEELRGEGKLVYVDFTAAWCITCQVNKRVVFSSDRVLEFIAANDVQLIRADWTNRDPIISAALESFGRAGVPFNLIYGPGLKNGPTELPALLTPGIVLSALEQAKKN